MPLRTPIYNLESFLWGEPYSSTADKRRFTIIDTQLAFLGDVIGEGRISGWEVSIKDLNSRTLSISSGMGIIGRKVLLSFGEFEFQLDNNVTEYIYMREKLNQIGGFSNFSSIFSIQQTDSTIPSSPSGLAPISSLITYSQISFEWDANTDADFSHYLIRRSADDAYDGFEEIAQSTDISYVDASLPQDTEFTYEVISVDLSGNNSNPSTIVISTLPDNRVPIAPLFFQLFANDGFVQAIWDNSPSENIDSYRLFVEELDSNGNTESSYSVSVAEQENDSTFNIVSDLTNNKNYKITLFSVNINGIESEGLVRFVKPSPSSGAGEVENISISFSRSQFEEVGIEADLSWDFVNADDPYGSLPNLFRITFIENSKRSSEPIGVLLVGEQISYSSTIRFLPFLNTDNNQVFESFKEYTPYLLVIQTVDSEGNISNGVIKRINRTPTFEVLPAVSDVTITRNPDDSVTSMWTNPSSQFFDYISLTVEILILNTNDVETVIEDVNIGQSSTYTVDNSLFQEGSRYRFTFTPMDIFNDPGISSSSTAQFLEEDTQERPEMPNNISVLSIDGGVRLDWDVDFSSVTNIKFFKVYRADNQVFIPPEDFSLLATLSSEKDSFIDYTAEGGVTYAYFVTAVDFFGNESLNPILDGYAPGNLPIAMIRDSSILSAPAGVSVLKSGSFGANVVWNGEVAEFDGYEIYRSTGNNYSFVLVGFAGPAASSFFDEDALLKDKEDYYYMVRKFKNEVQPIITSSAVVPSNSIILASVKTSTLASVQQISIDNTLARELANFEEPIREKTRLQIDDHRHIFEGNLDKRIQLRSNATITDWNTFDFKEYSTDSDITDSSSFVLRISGSVNEAFFTDSNGVKDVVAIRQAQAGISPILFEVDTANKKVVFIHSIYTTCVEPPPDPLNPDALPVCPVVPYSTEPSLTLELVNLSEVQGILPSEKVESISATQVTGGEIGTDYLPLIQHGGRIDEEIFPLQLPMSTVDNYVYEIANVFEDGDRNKAGASVSFYDIIQVGDDNNDILAATSSGVWFSCDFGNNWNKRFVFSEPVRRVFRSSEEAYFALTNYSVYKSTSPNFANWVKMDGLESVKVIRDIAEDSSSNVYITTDLGVFRLNADKPYIEDTWEQLQIFGPTSTDAYGIFFDNVNSRILIGNELGLVQSLDSGASWFYDADLPVNMKVQRFAKADNVIFALTDDSIFRKDDAATVFVKIADLGSSVARHILAFRDILYVTTDMGIRFSSTADIYNDTDIDFLPTFSLINIKGKAVVSTCINEVAERLLIGTDRRLFLLEKENLWLQYEQLGTSIPTIFVNGAEKKLGVYYNNGGESQNISFDESTLLDDVITMANKYDIYVAKSGGWAEQKFDATVKVRVNSIPFGESTGNIVVDKGEFTSFQFPDYTDLNSHEELTDTYKAAAEANITSIGDSDSLSSDSLRKLITDTFRNIEKFLSQLYEEARVVDSSLVALPNIVYNMVQKNKVIDSFGNLVDEEVDLGATINVTTGSIVFNTQFDKFDELKIDILGVTFKNAGELNHREVEDILELANSGLPSSLSQVQQVNLVKMGIFNERQWPGQQASFMSPPFQSEYTIPRGDSWFDVLNSTINYYKRVVKEDTNFRLNYVTSSLFVEERDVVFAGGKGGILSIGVSSLDIDEVDIDVSGQLVRSIRRNNDFIYVVTDKNVYLSEDWGASWEELDRTGLPNNLYSIGFVSNNIVIGAEDGLYYQSSNSIDWQKSVDSSFPVETIINPDLMFAVIDNNIHLSGDGFTFFKIDTKHDFNVNGLEKFGAAIYIGTDEGVYTDASSFYGSNPRMTFIEVESIEENIAVNDMNANNIQMAVGLDTNKYYLQQGEEFVVYPSSFVSSAQKVLAVNDDIWVFSYNNFIVSSLSGSMILSSGVPA